MNRKCFWSKMYLLFNQVNFFSTNDNTVCTASLYSYNWYQMSKFDVNLFHVISPMKKDGVWRKVHDSPSCIKTFHIFCKSWICLRYSKGVRKHSKHSKHSFDIEAVGFSTAFSTLNSLDFELIFSPILQTHIPTTLLSETLKKIQTLTKSDWRHK